MRFALGVSFWLLVLGPVLAAEPVDEKTFTLMLPGDVPLKMVRVAKGKFWMGSPADEKGRDKDEDQKEVTIAEDFYLGVYEVTQEQWEAVMGKGTNPSLFSRTGPGKDEVEDIKGNELRQFPVERVSWNDVQEFLKKLNKLEKNRDSGWVYRLPKEAEWEYACRGGASSIQQEERKTAPFYFAKPTSSLSSKQANFKGVFSYGDAAQGPYLGRSAKVGSYEPNALGIYDLHGNVREWCDDIYEEAPNRVIRGGCWCSGGGDCRAACRGGSVTWFRTYTLGFRLARVLSK